jgi:hypothetical protein
MEFEQPKVMDSPFAKGGADNLSIRLSDYHLRF